MSLCKLFVLSPDGKDAPSDARQESLFLFILCALFFCSVPAAAVNFYSDLKARHCDVDVIFADSHERNRNESEIFDNRNHLRLPLGENATRLNPNRPSSEAAKRSLGPTDCVVGGVRLEKSLPARHLGPLQALRLGAISPLESEATPSGVNRVPTDAAFTSQDFYTFPGDMKGVEARKLCVVENWHPSIVPHCGCRRLQ